MRILGTKTARCDATLRYGEVVEIDPQISGWNNCIFLCPETAERFPQVELYPRQWLRLACRISPHYRLLSGECYTRFGELWESDRTEDDRKGTTRAERFPDIDELAESPRALVAVGVAWSGDDMLVESGHGSFRQLVNRHTPDMLYGALDLLSGRKRQVEEIQDQINNVVTVFVARPSPAWIEKRWRERGVQCFQSLIDLSLRVWSWQVVEEHAGEVLARIPGNRRRWETSGWHTLMQAAPEKERARLRDIFLEGVPRDERDQIVQWLEHPGE